MEPIESALGRRVTIRLRDGLGYRDIVGILVSERSLINREGVEITFNPDEIAIWREIRKLPDRAGSGAPFSHRIHELEKLSETTWPPFKSIDFGKWHIRIANGLSLRANSVLPLGRAPFGEPDKDIDAAIETVIDLYRSEKIKPAFTLALPLYSEFDGYLESAGWDLAASAQFLVKDLIDPIDSEVNTSKGFDLVIDELASEKWLQAQGDHSLLSIMSAYPANYLAFTFGDKAIAVVRIAIYGSWSIPSRLFVLPEFRGQGLARALMLSAEKVASEMGATKIALQVESKNTSALELYKNMGYRHHHDYNYRILR